MRVKCNKCQHTIIPNPKQLEGCLCDPDAPTWVWVTGDKIGGLSHADYQILEN